MDPDDPSQPVAGGTPGGPTGQFTPQPLVDDSGHGTHVAGIISGCMPDGGQPRVAESNEPGNGGYVQRPHVARLSGMAPACELVSVKVMRRSSRGTWVTSSSALSVPLRTCEPRSTWTRGFCAFKGQHEPWLRVECRSVRRWPVAALPSREPAHRFRCGHGRLRGQLRRAYHPRGLGEHVRHHGLDHRTSTCGGLRRGRIHAPRRSRACSPTAPPTSAGSGTRRAQAWST